MFGQGNYGTQPLAMGGNKYEKRETQCHTKKLAHSDTKLTCLNEYKRIKSS